MKAITKFVVVITVGTLVILMFRGVHRLKHNSQPTTAAELRVNIDRFMRYEPISPFVFPWMSESGQNVDHSLLETYLNSGDITEQEWCLLRRPEIRIVRKAPLVICTTNVPGWTNQQE